MELKKFKIESEDETHYQIKHPSGKSFKVEKEKLSEKAHKVIQGLAQGGGVQKMANGGRSYPQEQPPGGMSVPINLGAMSTMDDETIARLNAMPNVNALPNSSQQQPQDFRRIPTLEELTPKMSPTQEDLENAPIPVPESKTISQPTRTPAQVDELATRAAAPELPVGTVVPSAPVAASSYNNMTVPRPTEPIAAANWDMENALKEQQKQNLAGAKALGGQGIAESKAISQGLKDINEQTLTANEIFDNFKTKDDELMKSYMDQKIDPNRFMGTGWKGAGNKVLSAIAITLGGMGPGQNVALDIIQKGIERDIEAQRNDQSQKMNLWKMNREQLGSEVAANTATQNQLYTGIKYQMMKAASDSQNPQAMARAQAANTIIDQQIAANRQKLAIMGGSDIPPERKIPLLVPPDRQKEAFEEVKNAQNVTYNAGRMFEYFDQAAKDTRVMSGGGLKGAISFAVKPASVMALHQAMLPNFSNIDGTVRQAAMDESFANVTPAWGDDDHKVALKRQALADWVESQKATPVTNGFGIDLKKYGPTSNAPQHKPGDVIQQKGMYFKVNPDGKTMQRIK